MAYPPTVDSDAGHELEDGLEVDPEFVFDVAGPALVGAADVWHGPAAVRVGPVVSARC